MVQSFNRQLGKKKSSRDLDKKKIGIIVIGLLVSSIAFVVLMFDNPASAEFRIENLTIEPGGSYTGENIEAGEKFRVTAKIVNLKTSPENFQIELKIDSKKMDSTKVSLGAREMMEETFYVPKGLEEGIHTIEVGNLVEEIELKKKENIETELMDDFSDVSGNEDYISLALDINMVSLKWIEDAGGIHGPNINIDILEALKCKLKVSPQINTDIGRFHPPPGTRYVYSLILDQDGDEEEDVTTGIIKKAPSDLGEHESNLVDYVKSEDRFEKGIECDACHIGWRGNVYLLQFHAFEIGNIKSFNWKVKTSCIKDNEVVASDILPNEGWASFP